MNEWMDNLLNELMNDWIEFKKKSRVDVKEWMNEWINE